MSIIAREKFTDRGDQCWAVKSPVGAVEFRVITSTDQPVAITLHSPRPMFGGDPGPCSLIGGGQCWNDVTFIGGRDLYRAWVDEGRDDEVIWGELESWHASRFAAEPVTTREA